MDFLQELETFDKYLDNNVSQDYKDQPLAQDWARVCKVIEEMGEAITALIGYTGQNPRKGTYMDLDDMLEEMADVLLTAALCIQHFTKNKTQTVQIVLDKWTHNYTRAGFEIDR